jgi:hypothetical protein
MPITMTDPEKNPRVGSMVLAMGAIWETSPNDTQFVDMPQLWKEGFQIIASTKEQIMQSLSVNSSMVPGATSGKKPSQNEIAQEQQVALASTADVVTVLEQSIYNPLLEWFYELDHQFRDDDMLVQVYGELGQQARMEEVPPIELGNRMFFKWYGSESTKNAQQIQQQIGLLNVLRGIPPQQMNGLTLNIAPLLQQIVENGFGPRLGPKVLIDQRHQLTVDPMVENDFLHSGLPAEVHPMDDDIQHMQVHQMAVRAHGDTHGTFRTHMLTHMQQMKAKAAAAMQPAPGQGGGPGQPRMGAAPGQQRPAQAPPGAIHADQMQDPAAMQRKTI